MGKIILNNKTRTKYVAEKNYINSTKRIDYKILFIFIPTIERKNHKEEK